MGEPAKVRSISLLTRLQESDPTEGMQCRRLRALTRCSFDFLWESRLTGPGLEGSVHFLRDIGAELGFAPGEFPSSIEEILERFHPEDRAEAFRLRLRAREYNEPFHSEFRLPGADGEYFWFEEHAVPPLPEDPEGVWLGAVRNITARKRAEEERRRALDDLSHIRKQLEVENVHLREERDHRWRIDQVVGESPAHLQTLEKIEQVAGTRSTVLLTGETGTGKELAARTLHRLGQNPAGPFVVLNCGALPASLIESELFGHQRGAFTGAVSQRIGRLEAAHGGTLLLDEIGEFPLELQSKLLRALESGEYERLGENRTRTATVRMIAATNRDLEQAVEDGSFREDLYYRLAVFPIHLPPLRERKEDIPLLATFLAEKHALAMTKEIETIPRAALEALLDYDWPGNIRELSNVIERAVILSSGPELALEQAFRSLSAPSNGATAVRRGMDRRSSPTSETLEAMERDHILRVCEACDWHIKGPDQAAERLGLKPSTLYSRMGKLGIQRPHDGSERR